MAILEHNLHYLVALFCLRRSAQSTIDLKLDIEDSKSFSNIIFYNTNDSVTSRYCKVRNIGVLKFSELINFSILANRNISECRWPPNTETRLEACAKFFELNTDVRDYQVTGTLHKIIKVSTLLYSSIELVVVGT